MIRPLLAASIDMEEELQEVLKTHGTLMVSEKKDGIRTCTEKGGLMSRTGELIRNQRIQEYFKRLHLPEGIEAELVFNIDTYEVHPPLEHINSVVSSDNEQWPRRWTPCLYAFDWQMDKPFIQRYRELKTIERAVYHESFRVLPQYEFGLTSHILAKFRFITQRGGEGICLRNKLAYYKSGRATLKGGELMRFKKLMRDTASIVGFTNLLTHIGEQEIDPFGLAKRGSKKVDLHAEEKLGALICNHPIFGEFKLGSGFTDTQRRNMWEFQSTLLHRKALFEYRDTTAKGKPRNPIFKELIW